MSSCGLLSLDPSSSIQQLASGLRFATSGLLQLIMACRLTHEQLSLCSLDPSCVKQQLATLLDLPKVAFIVRQGLQTYT